MKSNEDKTSSDKFNYKKLRFARERRQFTIKALSEQLEVSSRILSDYENGHRIPPIKTISRISELLNFPLHFFFMVDMSELEENAISFRSLARMSANDKNAAIRSGQIALDLTKWIEQRYVMPSVEIPDLMGYRPDTAAEVLRNHWGMGEKPINNMVQILEAKGIRVFSLVREATDMDAYSFWMDKKPFVFLNTVKSVERGRFDAAHELGHLVLHKHGNPKGKEVESQANAFASAFLMPKGSIMSYGTRNPTLGNVISLKAIWKVSASALVRRFKDLDLITEWQYRTLNIELSQRGYLKEEPQPIIMRETSKLMPSFFKLLKEDGISKESIANELGVYVDEINELMFNLAITSIDGGSRKPAPKTNNDYLRIIK